MKQSNQQAKQITSNQFVRPYQPKPTLVKKTNTEKQPQKAQGLNPKDLEILQVVLEMRYLTETQIAKKFFAPVSFVTEKAASYTIKQLQSEGFLTTKGEPGTATALYLATAKAHKLLTSENPDSKIPKLTKSVFQPRVKHDLLLSDLRIRFEELGFLNKWVSETALEEIPYLKRQFQDLPDAFCKKRNEKGYFLELEVSMKSPKVYRARIEEYLKILSLEEIKDAEIEGAVFFCTDEKVREKIKEQIPKDTKNISVLLYESYFPKKEVAHES